MATPGVNHRAAIWCAILLVALVGTSFEALSAMIGTWRTVATYNHGFLILPISLFLVWIQRKELASLEPEQEPVALVFLVGGAALWLVSAAAEVATSRRSPSSKWLCLWFCSASAGRSRSD